MADQIKASAEKIIAKSGGSYDQLERERINLLLIDEVSKGLDDVTMGRTKDARAAIAALKNR
jgi:hypothetical protein